MKLLLLAFIMVNLKTQAACLPEFSNEKSPVVENPFYSVAEMQVQHFETLAEASIAKNWDIVVRIDPLNPRVNAQINKSGSVAVIEVWGGMLNQAQMNQDVLTLLLCHELGHLLGGPPLKSRNGWSSTEGQADYYSTAHCARLMGLGEERFYESAQDLAHIYAKVTGEVYPELRTCDQGVVERTNFGYPSAQCRLDTLVAGWTQQVRPVCWFKD